MGWTTVNEIGLIYPSDSNPAHTPSSQRLVFPSLLQRFDDGSYLIVDELWGPKSLTVAFDCRTLRVARDGEIRYDSIDRGIGDGCGCAMDDGFIALLRRTTWELLIVSPEGEVRRRFPLWNFTKRTPRAVSWTARKTFLISFLDSVFEVDILEIDADGRLLWFMPVGHARIGCPSNVQMTPGGGVLVADEFAHVVLEIDRDGQVQWQYGAFKDPSDRPDRLSSPAAIRLAPDGSRVISDTRNHRVLTVSPNGDLEQITPADGYLSNPTFADILPDGHLLICDAGNARVFELDRWGKMVWQFGNRAIPRRLLSFPRSVEPIPRGGLLIADTANNRIVEFKQGSLAICPFDDADPLFWPRCARRSFSHTNLIADGRNGRIIEVSPAGRILHRLDALYLTSHPRLKDPHDARPLPDGNILIVDPSNDLVAIADWLGRVSWIAGAEGTVKLKDPHSAQLLDDGTVFICDSGNSRVLWVDRRGQIVRSQESFRFGPHLLRLNRPRFAEIGPDGIMVIADTANNRIVAVDSHGELIWLLTDIPGSHITDLDQPRWAHLLNRDEVLVCDHYHHRILHLRHEVSVSP
jgi:hypothetical protein